MKCDVDEYDIVFRGAVCCFMVASGGEQIWKPEFAKNRSGYSESFTKSLDRSPCDMSIDTRQGSNRYATQIESGIIPEIGP